jgi:hypothetical protein
MVNRRQVLHFRVRAQQLDRARGKLSNTALLDLGAQDTGPDGGRWALALRGLDPDSLNDSALALLWTVRGAPHFYRRPEVPEVAAAVAPMSDADAGKRIYNASKPLKAAGIGNLDGLDAVATAMRRIVTAPMVKGEVSSRLAAVMPAPYLRFCRPCNATHLYEMPFRLAALRAGLELQPDTSPPVLQPISGWTDRADAAGPALDVIRAYLRLLGPATPSHVAGYLDAPLTDVKLHWPADAQEVTVEGQQRWILAADADRLAADPVSVTRLLGPFDLFLQAKDRPLLVPDAARTKQLWPVLGRPGAVLVDGELAGAWRPRKSGSKLTVAVWLWDSMTATARGRIDEQAERLAAFRGVGLAGVDYCD